MRSTSNQTGRRPLLLPLRGGWAASRLVFQLVLKEHNLLPVRQLALLTNPGRDPERHFSLETHAVAQLGHGDELRVISSGRRRGRLVFAFRDTEGRTGVQPSLAAPVRVPI